MKGKNGKRNYYRTPHLPPHPVDERGLPVIPESISLECNPAECRYNRPHKDRQHVMHPANEYRTPIESEFRNLGCFVITMCRCQHENWDRGIAPPKHVSPELMKQVINEYQQGEYTMERQGQLFETPTDIRSEIESLENQMWDKLDEIKVLKIARLALVSQLREDGHE